MDLAQDYNYYLASICPHYNSGIERREGVMMTLGVPSYQSQLGTNIQQSLKCSGILFTPVYSYSSK